jgi:hypothetical protein
VLAACFLSISAIQKFMQWFVDRFGVSEANTNLSLALADAREAGQGPAVKKQLVALIVRLGFK